MEMSKMGMEQCLNKMAAIFAMLIKVQLSGFLRRVFQ